MRNDPIWHHGATTLHACRDRCRSCGSSWLRRSRQHGASTLRCLRLLLESANLCEAAAEMLPGNAAHSLAVLKTQLRACAATCARCSRELRIVRGGCVQECCAACEAAAALCAEIHARIVAQPAPAAGPNQDFG